MNPVTLLETLEKQDIRLSVTASHTLEIDAPEHAITAELADMIRAHKAELLQTLAPAPFYRVIVNTVPPLRCSHCGNVYGPDYWRLNQLRNRWECLDCHTIGMLNYQRVIVASTGQDAITEAVAFLDRIKEQGCFIRYYENGKCGLTVPEQWNAAQFEQVADAVVLRDEILRRLIPARPGAPVAYEHTEQVTPPVHTERHTEPLPMIAPSAAPAPDEQALSTLVEQEPDAARQWVTIYADIHAGYAITEQGETFTYAPDCSLSTFLALAHEHTEQVNRVYLCGARPGGDTAEGFINWLADADMMELYTTDKRGHYFDMLRPDSSVARYVNRASKRAIDIRRITAWLGDDRDSQDEQRYTADDARAALALVTRYVRQSFPFFKHLSGTPSSTFKLLWTTGNRIAGKQFIPLADDMRGLIHGNTGQGRIEYFSKHCAGKIPGLFYYDGIFMYAALAWGMPTELALHDNKNEYAGKVPARYRIRFTVPQGWRHIGLFMTKRDGAGAGDKDGWFYPGAAEAGNTYETWADGSELDIAFNLPQGMPAWEITILERMVFKPESESGVTKPLETITRKIVAMREQIDADKRQDAARVAVYDLARGAIRNILLHGIGSFNRASRTRSYILLDTEPAPAGYLTYDELDKHRRLYTVSEESADESMSFPQWAALIWARCRARMTKAALSRPCSEIITIRTDAIAVTRPVPAWESNTKTGYMRRKWGIEKPLVAPKNHDEFDALQRKITKR